MLRSVVLPCLLLALAPALPGCAPSEAAPAPVEALTEPEDPSTAPVQTVASPDTTDERPELPEGFVRLRDVAPGIAQEMRYATAYNFIGEPIDGYLAPECILTEPAADALAEAARRLARQHLGLKVYDCYRPQTAVDHFARWTGYDDQSMKEAFYPSEAKGWLFSLGYIATRSGHSRGSTVDLTLVRLPAAASVRTDFPTPDEPLPRCDRPLGTPTGPDLEGGGRLPEGDFDMGTAYDCLSPLAATDSPDVSATARRNRNRLRTALSEAGFRNYSKEWWHFTLRGEPHPRTYFDFPVE